MVRCYECGVMLNDDEGNFCSDDCEEDYYASSAGELGKNRGES